MVVSRPAGRILRPLLLLLMAAAVTRSPGAAQDATLLRPDRVFEGDPARDITALRRMALVMKGGEVVRGPRS